VLPGKKESQIYMLMKLWQGSCATSRRLTNPVPIRGKDVRVREINAVERGERALRQRLGYRWQDFKSRFGAVMFIDVDGNPVCESTLTDEEKMHILVRYTRPASVSLIDLTPERQPATRRPRFLHPLRSRS
jgi:hypothetical protein